MLFTEGWAPKKHEVETQSARLERDFAIHKVLPVLITGGWGHQRGEGRGHDFTITPLLLHVPMAAKLLQTPVDA